MTSYGIRNGPGMLIFGIPPSQILYVFSSALNPGNKGKDANDVGLLSWDGRIEKYLF